MILLDLYCCAGGAAMGYFEAGFTDIIGVDIDNQPNYPFTFYKGDAISIARQLLKQYKFDAIHASPPCQKFSVNTKQHGTMYKHPDLIDSTRQLCIESGLPYIIENVVGAPLINPIILCGSMFGLEQLRRHRLFECSPRLDHGLKCNHSIQKNCISVAGHAGGGSTRDGSSRFGSTDKWRELMGMEWASGHELAEAIPPIYTKTLGKLLKNVILHPTR